VDHAGMRASHIIYLAGLVVYIAIRGVYGARTKTNEKVVSRADTRDRLLIATVFVGSIILPVFAVSTSWFAFADYHLPVFVQWAGAIVLVFALWLFRRAHIDLGRNWSITLEMRKDHELIDHGVYRRIRHPMYTAIFLFAIAQGLVIQNWLGGWAGFVSVLALYLGRVSSEEAMMCEFFGQPYREYMQRTGRLWPRRGGR
jgi:protein-S-isoprenylcysteine O-methyltransferase Ste14